MRPLCVCTAAVIFVWCTYCVYDVWCSLTGWQRSTFVCRDYLLFICLMSSYQCSGCPRSDCSWTCSFFICWLSQMKSCSEDCNAQRIWLKPTWLKLHRVCCEWKHVWNSREDVDVVSCVYLLFSYFAVYWVYCNNTAAGSVCVFFFISY